MTVTAPGSINTVGDQRVRRRRYIDARFCGWGCRKGSWVAEWTYSKGALFLRIASDRWRLVGARGASAPSVSSAIVLPRETRARPFVVGVPSIGLLVLLVWASTVARSGGTGLVARAASWILWSGLVFGFGCRA